MRIKIKYQKIIVLSIQVMMLIFSMVYFLLQGNEATDELYLSYALMGTVISVVDTILLCVVQYNIFTIINLTFLSFWVFQFGLPVCYVFVKDFSNFYINLFSIETLINGEKYTILAIQVFCLAFSFAYQERRNRKNRIVFEKCSWNKNTVWVSKVAFILFVLAALIEVPLVLYSAYATRNLGFWAASTRTFLSSNAIYRAIQAFCVPFGFLCMIYSNNKLRKKMVQIIIIIIGLLQLVAGDRANGLASILALVYYRVFNDEKVEQKKSSRKIKNLGKQVLFGIILALMLLVLVYVGIARVSDQSISISDVLATGIFKKFFAELGLNFTTVCFVMDYIPDFSSFRLGMTYIEALICIIPKTLDPTGFIASITTPEIWLFNTNHQVYGNLLDFGVGFSIIGESYMNFSWGGLIVVFIIGILVMKFINVDFSSNTRWGKYIQIVLLMSLMTFARRGFYDLVKDIEYSVFAVGLFLSLLYKIKRS